MAYTAPTSADLIVRFPMFKDVAPEVIDTALAQAALMVDDTWVSQEDFTLGRLLYSAHVLTLDGHGASAEAELAATGALGFSEFDSGDLRLRRAGSTAETTFTTFDQTQHGQRFKELLRRNKPGVAVACD